jgi:hypothetical protein
MMGVVVFCGSTQGYALFTQTALQYSGQAVFFERRKKKQLKINIEN